METPDEPPDLERLEELLKSRHDPLMEASSRVRILRHVRTEMLRRKNTATGRRWQFAAGLAAAVMLGLNLSMSVGNAGDWGSNPVAQNTTQDTAIEQLREILPELNDAELHQQARLLICAAPRRSGASRFPILNSTERAETWDMR